MSRRQVHYVTKTVIASFEYAKLKYEGLAKCIVKNFIAVT